MLIIVDCANMWGNKSMLMRINANLWNQSLAH